MRFDTVLIGGGLSSLVCGILLQREGKKCLMISAGQNALHFSSGAFGLLGCMPDGTPVDAPFEAFSALDPSHPYRKIGRTLCESYADAAVPFFASCGIPLQGFGRRNGYRLTASGSFKRAWLAFQDVPFFSSDDALDGKRALIVTLDGFLDFYPEMLSDGLRRRGVESRCVSVHLSCLDALRGGPGEMRSVGIARILNRETNWKQFGREVRALLDGEDLVIVPEVFGLEDRIVNEWIAEMIPAQVLYVGTMPPSVSGIRVQRLLKNAFIQAGGTFLMGDTACDPEWAPDGTVRCIHTANLGAPGIEADSFVHAGGHLFGRGIESHPDGFSDPVFGLDVVCDADRASWVERGFFQAQPYMGYGIGTDERFRGLKDGRTVENLYVAGAQLAGCNSLQEGSGAGVAVMSAMHIAADILKRTENVGE